MSRARRLIAVPLLCYYFAAHGLTSEPVSTAPVGKEQHTVQRLEETIREELAQRQPIQVEQAVTEELRITLSAIKIHGASLLGDVELEASVSKFVGIAMSYEQMFEVAMAVEAYYRQHNYLARVVLPTQNISDGVLELEVIESVITLAEVDKKLEEFPNTRAQMDALIGPQQSQEIAKSGHPKDDADVELLLGMYQSRSPAPSAKLDAEQVSSNLIADFVALVSDLSGISDRKEHAFSVSQISSSEADELVSTVDDVRMVKSSTQKIPMWHEPLTRRRRFMSDLLSARQMEAA